MKQLFLLSFTAIVFFSCKKEQGPLPPANITDSTRLNESYGSDAAQKMDFYLPANRSTTATKVFILIHGGAWSGGDKNDFKPFIDTLKHRFPDFAIFNINYRLAANPYNLFPTQEMDVKAAVEYIYNHRTNFLISDKFILLGASAGAHLAMLQAYKYNSPVKARAVVDFFGPSDMTEMYNNPVGGNILLSLLVAQVVGYIPTQNPTIYNNSSPVNFITASTAMLTIMLHGCNDPLVNPSQSIAVQNKLNAANIPNQYVFYPSGGHGDWDAPTYADAFSKIQAFINTNVP